MTTAEIINRLFKVYPWAVLGKVGASMLVATVGCRVYTIINCDDTFVVAEHNTDTQQLAYDQSHALHLRDVLLGKKRDDAGNVA